jgi:hypothetical protein
MRKRSNTKPDDELKKREWNDTKIFFVLLIILSTICMIAAFVLPEYIGKWVIILSVFIGGGYYWWYIDKKKREQ